MAAWPRQPAPIVLTGPTAAGKTAVAVALAERLQGEIVNADSMQVYRSMDIGTAKPSPDERQRAPFHLLDLVTPDLLFSVSEWKERAEAAIMDIAARERRPIVCGGTGLYIKALLESWSLAATPADPEVRSALKAEAERSGAPALHARLQTVDAFTAARLHPNDAVRIVRALEVYQVTGQPISAFQRRDQEARAPRPAVRLALTLPRAELYARIEARVERMIGEGLEDEARRLLDQGYSPTLGPLRSLGYKEMIAYLCGETDRTTAIANIKLETRRFAKRQLTWFRADPDLLWFDVSAQDSAAVAQRLHAYLHERGAL